MAKKRGPRKLLSQLIAESKARTELLLAQKLEEDARFEAKRHHRIARKVIQSARDGDAQARAALAQVLDDVPSPLQRAFDAWERDFDVPGHPATVSDAKGAAPPAADAGSDAIEEEPSSTVARVGGASDEGRAQ